MLKTNLLNINNYVKQYEKINKLTASDILVLLIITNSTREHMVKTPLIHDNGRGGQEFKNRKISPKTKLQQIKQVII